ncbi:MAG: hypothetical protein LBR09_01410 [Endomicrobium sp.]|jgi:acetyl-CoA carboxylase biotin carboxyl carrier protein|nr:hypothetical protein [Endomicrobium sp.]
MDLQEIKEFLKSTKNTDIEEMRYQNDKYYIYFKKSDATMTATDKASETVIIDKDKEEKKEDKKEEEKLPPTYIKSPMVGTFISVQNNDKYPFVKEGDNITVGQKIGQIEAMKIIKDVHSNAKGKILKVLVSNGQAVEYGQELFLVDNADGDADNNS